MQVTFYGVRGSIPTPGPSTMRYGGNTLCVGVRTLDGTLLILDAGTGLRVLGQELMAAPLPEAIHVFVTHKHWDHIMGAPFFGPLWRPQARIVLHALSPRAQTGLARLVLFDGEHFPVRAQDIPAQLERPPFTEPRIRLGSAVVSQIPLNHPGGADGFRIDDADGASVCYLTDNELHPPGPVTTSADSLARFAAGTGLLIHDAQYLPEEMAAKRGWGHSAVDDVLELGLCAGARTVALIHHDPMRTDEALDAIADRARAWASARVPGMTSLVAAEGLALQLPGRDGISS
ncbi:MAG TPA: MBL fold metallo-hydrolase [Isosphaeraceae bacterium]|jgi:phosphoribosyl 1,2-cyclic phosphodiesterase